MGLSGVVGLTRVRPGGRLVHTGSLCSLERAQVVVGFIQCRCVHSSAPWWSWRSLLHALELFGTTGVVGLTRTPPRVLLASFGVIGFTNAVGVGGAIRVGWGHSRAPFGWLGSSGVVGFTRARPGDHWVRPGSFRSLARALGIIRFFRSCERNALQGAQE